MNKKKIISIAVALGLVISLNTTVLADPALDKQLQDQKNQLQQNQDELKKTQDQRQALQTSVEKLDNDIQNTMVQCDNINSQIKTTQAAIDSAKADIGKTEKDLQTEQDLFDKRMNTMYQKGSNGYLSVLLDSNSISDFLARVEYVKQIAQFDNKLLADFKAKEAELQKKKDALDVQNTKLQGLKSQYEQKAATLQQDRNTQNNMVTQLQAQEKEYASKIGQNNADIQATNKKIQAAIQAQAAQEAAARSKASSDSSVISRGGAAYSGAAYDGNTITSIAFSVGYDSNGNCRNIPYGWGANGPSSFDCSGFVIYVFAKAGLSPFGGTRTTYDMINYGKTVSRDQLQAGDVIYFGSASDPHHVAIYMGDGMIIHAPHTGDVVRMASLSDFPDYYIAKRMN